MSFLSMLIALSLNQVLQPRAVRPGDEALHAWRRWLTERLAAPEVQVLVCLAVPLALLYWVLETLDGWLFGLPTLLVTAAVLLWSLGREDYHTEIERYIARGESGDAEGAWLGVQGLWVPQLPLAAGPGGEETPAQAAQAGVERLIYCGYQRWFAPLFYFLLLGPIAAAAYRLVFLYAGEESGARFRDVLWWLDWIPSRLLALSFAVTGDFMAVVRRARPDRASAASSLLYSAAVAALEEPGARDIRDLLYRTAGLWLGVASLLIIAF